MIRSFIVVSLLISSCWQTVLAQTIKVCYTPEQYGINGANRSFADEKLTNTANFGPSGTSNYSFTLFNFASTSITYASLIANGCQVFDAGITNTDAGNGTGTSTLTTTEKDALLQWTLEPGHLILGYQGFTRYWAGTAYTAGTGNNNPNSLTTTGQQIVSGPFGTVASFNQGGSYQGIFTATSPNSCRILQDNTGDATGIIDIATGDIFLADVDLISELGGLTSNNGISSNTDKLYANLMHGIAQLVTLKPDNACTYLNCIAGKVPPVLSSGTMQSVCNPGNITSLFTGTTPANATLTWHSALPVSDTNYISDINNFVISDTVYAAFRANDGTCYSPSSPVIVSVSSPDLSIQVSSISPAVASGETQTYTVTVTNNGPVAAPNASVKVPIPDQRSLLLANPSQGTYSGSSAIWQVGALSNGQSASLVITMKID